MKKGRSLIIPFLFAVFSVHPDLLADWSTAKRLTWTSGGSYIPAVAADSNDAIHVVWSDGTPYNYEIYYTRSEDAGATWNAAKRLTWTSGASAVPAMAIDSNDAIHVVWSDDTPGNFEIYYKKSTDAGDTWSTAKRLTSTSGASAVPAIAVDSNNTIHVIWSDEISGSTEIYQKRSTDAGLTWETAKRLTWTSGSSGAPAIAKGSGIDLHIVWEDYTPGNQEIYYKKSTDGGITWSPAERLTWTSSKSYTPAIALDPSGAVHIVWEDSMAGNSEIYYKRSTDGGTTWSPAKRLSWNSGNSSSSTIGINSSGAIYVVWQDDTPGVPELFCRRSTAGGTTWSPLERLTWTSGSSYLPAIALDSSNTIHVVWSDDTPGNPEIYYKKGN